MAIFLIHLRRIILLSCVVYLFCELVEDLMESVSCNYFIRKRKKFTIQAWIHVYFIYTYLLIMMNLPGMRRWDQVNLFEFLFSTTSWRHKIIFPYISLSLSLPFLSTLLFIIKKTNERNRSAKKKCEKIWRRIHKFLKNLLSLKCVCLNECAHDFFWIFSRVKTQYNIANDRKTLSHV